MMYFVKNRPVDLPCRKADPWYACRYDFYTLLQTRKISWLVKEEKIQWKSNMSYTLFVTAWPFFLLTWQKCLFVAVTSRVICMAVGIGKAWLMWPGRVEVVYVSLAVCLSLRGKHRLVLTFRRLWFTTYQMNYWNGNTKEYGATCH